jgi:hypothetical protein
VTEVRDEWVRLSTATARQRVSAAASVTPPAIILSSSAFQVERLFYRDASLLTVVLVCLGTLVVISALATGLYFFFRPMPVANFSTREIRVRRRTIPFGEIDSAVTELISTYRAKTRLVALRFGKVNGLRASVVIADSGRPTLDAITRERLADVFRQSNIRMPTSSYDPTGAFARYNFPGHLNRDEAIDFALHPPMPGQPMPWMKGIESPEA